LTVEEIIEKYAICYGGGNTLAVHGAVNEAQIEQIRTMKPQILEYFRNQQKEKQERQRKAHAVVNAIPGVCELRNYFSQTEIAMPFDDFLQQFPEIDFKLAQVVLRIEQDRFSPNQAMCNLAQSTFDSLAAGMDPGAVAFRYEKEWATLFHERVTWGK